MSASAVSPASSHAIAAPFEASPSSPIPRYGEILLEVEAIAKDGAHLDGRSESLRALSLRLFRVAMKTRALAHDNIKRRKESTESLPQRVPRDAADVYPLAHKLYLPLYRDCLKGGDMRSLAAEHGISLTHARRGLVRVHEMMTLRACMRAVAIGKPVPCPSVSFTSSKDLAKHRAELEPLVSYFETELELLAKGHPHDEIVREVWAFSKNDVSVQIGTRSC